MSTFCGLIDEIPLMSVDRFCDENLKSKIFFLSHCHSDHMKGLYDYLELKGPLYASPASIVFLKKQYPHLRFPLYSLELNCPQEIQYADDDSKSKNTILVTTLPARHCPGSVMFLFQTQNLNVLYTGDFRVTHPDLEKSFSILQNTQIDVMYLDSTFLDEDYKEFPKQIDSINTIIKLIDEWLSKNSKNKIILELPAQYGSEYLFIEINRKLNERIYVVDKQQAKYIYFPSMDNCITDNRENSRILVLNKYSNKFYGNERDYYMIIKPTALFWKNWKNGNPLISENLSACPKEIRVVCSYHCSLSEIKDFLNFVRPRHVKLNALPTSEYFVEIMYKTLEKIYPNEFIRNIKICAEQTDDDYTLCVRKEKVLNFSDNIFINYNYKSDEDDDKPPRKRLPRRTKL